MSAMHTMEDESHSPTQLGKDGGVRRSRDVLFLEDGTKCSSYSAVRL